MILSINNRLTYVQKIELYENELTMKIEYLERMLIETCNIFLDDLINF
jgi:hypothetical protein